MSTDLSVIYEDQCSVFLDAAVRTALSHREKQYEEYALGQLEATANFVYVLCAESKSWDDLENLCQKHAEYAIRRLSEINPPENDVTIKVKDRC